MAARAAPAIARLGTPSSNTGPLDEQELLRELTELETTLSYKGWQKDAAESEEYYTLTYLALLVKKMSEMRHKQQRHGDVYGVRSDPLLRDLDELKATLSYDGWHEDAAKVEEVYITCAEHSRGSMDKMRRKQQLHDVRKVTPPRSRFPPDLKLLRELDPLFTEYELACRMCVFLRWMAGERSRDVSAIHEGSLLRARHACRDATEPGRESGG